MASTTNNSGIDGDTNDLYGPDEKWDDETEQQFRERMERKEEAKERAKIEKGREMPPCIG